MRRYDAFVEDAAIASYLSGMPVTQVGKHVGVDTATVYYILKRRGVALRRGHRKADLRAFAKNGEYTAEQKYWAGFLLADGCISDTGNGHPCLVLGLQDSDKRHVEKFAAFLKSNHKIRWNPESNQWLLQIRSQHWIGDLAPFGIKPRKSLIAEIPPEFKTDRDLWRGLIDGNGCVRWASHEKYKLACVYICGTESICRDFSLVGEMLTGSRMSVTCDGQNCFRCTYTGQKAVVILQWLYKNSLDYLERKHRTAIEMIAD